MEALKIAPGLPQTRPEATKERARPKADLQSAPSTEARGPEPAPPKAQSATFSALEAKPTLPLDPRERVAEREQVAEKIERELQSSSPHDMEVRYSEEDDRFIVTVLDPENGDIVRQIPAEEVLSAQQRLNELRGLLFDEQS